VWGGSEKHREGETSFGGGLDREGKKLEEKVRGGGDVDGMSGGGVWEEKMQWRDGGGGEKKSKSVEERGEERA